MGRFSIGARVRDEDGDEGVIVGKPSKGWRTVAYEGMLAGLKRGRPKKSLTPIDVAPAPAAQEQWQPKVGDRVRVVDPKCMRINTPVGAKGVVTAVSGGEYFDIDLEHPTDGTINQWVNAKNVQPITDEPATSPVVAETLWAPVVGKYGKTRDGRKVGPVREEDGYFTTNGWHYAANGECCYKGRSGAHVRPEHDLIAEWVDDAPVVAVEAVQPAVTDTTPERKFKVGDRVTPEPEQLQKVVDHWNQHWAEQHGRAHADIFYVRSDERDFLGIRISATEDGEGPWWPGEYFELVTAPPAQAGGATTPTDSFIVARLTAKGEPRPNVRPHVHAILEAAEAEAQRLADRLGDEFAVYQRVATRTVDAGPVPSKWGDPFSVADAKAWLKSGDANAGNNGMAFAWSESKQGSFFWARQAEDGLTHLGRAILKKWIAEAEAANDNTKAAA